MRALGINPLPGWESLSRREMTEEELAKANKEVDAALDSRNESRLYAAILKRFPGYGMTKADARQLAKDMLDDMKEQRREENKRLLSFFTPEVKAKQKRLAKARMVATVRAQAEKQKREDEAKGVRKRRSDVVGKVTKQVDKTGRSIQGRPKHEEDADYGGARRGSRRAAGRRSP